MNNLTKLVEQSKTLAFSEAKKFGVPSIFHIELAHKIGQRLAEKHLANMEVVEIGTYLMDCMLGPAFKEGRQKDHIRMGVEKTKQLLFSYDISNDIKENILACVNEHHGIKTFSTLEAEICCNADCYRFASVEGFIGGIHHGRKMNIEDLITLYGEKAEEKRNALSLVECKQELRFQYKAIQAIISNFSH